MKEKLEDELLARFRKCYGRDPMVVAYAPGRVEVLGNHTDYNEGLVLSAAIDSGTFFAVSPSDGDGCRLVAGDLMREVRFPVGAPRPSVEDSWSNYCKGVLAGLLPLGDFAHGFEALFLGDIPQGCGLSSSAALEMATGLALAKLYGVEPGAIALAKIGREAEHSFAGVKCGLLDQISSLFGKRGMLVLTDFRSLDVQRVPFGDDAVLLLFDPDARHALVDGAYNERRGDCEAATAFFKGRLGHPVRALRDVSWAEWQSLRDELPERVARRAAHPIGEDERVAEGARLLAGGDLAGFGKLMFASHDSSVRYFENSCPELDAVVDAARRVPGILGARLSGGGFGGCVVALAPRGQADAAGRAVADEYAARTGRRCKVRAITPGDGARVTRP